MNEFKSLFKLKNKVKRSLLCKKKDIKITKYTKNINLSKIIKLIFTN